MQSLRIRVDLHELIVQRPFRGSLDGNVAGGDKSGGNVSNVGSGSRSLEPGGEGDFERPDCGSFFQRKKEHRFPVYGSRVLHFEYYQYHGLLKSNQEFTNQSDKSPSIPIRIGFHRLEWHKFATGFTINSRRVFHNKYKDMYKKGAGLEKNGGRRHVDM